jgi:tetratricopeptide (TPR) repeat protein
MSWVTVDRLCEQQRLVDEEVRSLLEANNRPLRSSAGDLSDAELLDKLRGFGLDLDRHSLEKLCASALSAEEVARPLIASRGFRSASEHIQGDWIWICVVSLWQRWWPDRVCLELVDDKVQAGYGEFEHDQNACAAAWLDAWSDVLRLCDATGIRSIEAFDERFPMTQSLYNWSQDLEDVLWNAGLSDREMLRARIAVCAEALRRFPAEDQQMTENRRRALAESYFELGETGKAEELFESWLADDPRWGFGWIGWAGCYIPDARRPNDYSRAEELLSRGYATPDVRDRAVIADWLQVLCEDTGRQREAEEFARQAEKLRRQPPRVSVSPRLKLAEEHEETSANAPARPARTVKVGRNAPCPCGSGKKYKKCCGSPHAGDRAADA